MKLECFSASGLWSRGHGLVVRLVPVVEPSPWREGCVPGLPRREAVVPLVPRVEAASGREVCSSPGLTSPSPVSRHHRVAIICSLFHLIFTLFYSENLEEGIGCSVQKDFSSATETDSHQRGRRVKDSSCLSLRLNVENSSETLSHVVRSKFSRVPLSNFESALHVQFRSPTEGE